MLANGQSPGRRRRKLILDVKIGPSSTDHWTLADALLADLETTLALNGNVTLGDDYNYDNNNNDDDEAMYYEQDELRQSYHSDARVRSSPTPPPLPPLPSRELLDTVHASTNGLYREYSPSNRQVYSSTITVSKTIYDPDGTQQQQEKMISTSRASPRLHSSPRSTLDRDRRSAGLDNRTPSVASSNLSELDTLLDDLNTSAKMYSSSTLERRMAGRSAHSLSPRDPGLKPTASTPLSSTMRSSSAQRELEIPKLSTLQQSTPSPQSLSPQIRDEVGITRSRLSPSFQAASVRHQHNVEQQLRQPSLVKVWEQPVYNPVVIQNNGDDALLGQASARQQYADRGQAFMSHPQQQSLVHSYQEQRVVSETQQLPTNMPAAHAAPPSDPSGLSPQRSTGGKHVRVLDASGRDVQIHAGMDDTDLRQERAVVQQSQSQPLQSQAVSSAPTQQTASSGTSPYNELEDIMASMSEFDRLAGQSSRSAGDVLYSQPVKVKSSAGVSSALTENAGSSYDRGMQVLSPGVNGLDAQPSPSAYHRPVPQPTELRSSRAVMSDSQAAGKAGAMQGRLAGFDENGLPLVQKGDCGVCRQPITGQVLLALDTMWHLEHFLCSYCKRQLGTDIFYENGGLPYCELDYQELFVPKCAECNTTIMDNCVTAIGKNFHLDCFVCFECHLPFDGSGFYELNGAMYCERHFLAHRGQPCAACGQAIGGRCVTAMYKKYHPEHFVCTFCVQPLNRGTFKEQSEKPYCHACFDKLFG